MNSGTLLVGVVIGFCLGAAAAYWSASEVIAKMRRQIREQRP